MIDEWVSSAERLCLKPADLYTGARKILRGRQLIFEDLDNDLAMADAGYTRSKMTMLKRLYLHEESRDAALSLWDRRRGQGKYGSVGFTCYNHLLKTDPNKKSKRASVMGPCLQSVVLTLTDKGQVGVDVFYRTTEVFKKFPADLVFLRDVLLADFDLTGFESMTCHFANITVHPMYYVTIIPHQDDPIRTLDRLRQRDAYFYNWVVKWSARYLCDEYHRGIAKFAQAMRVCKDARSRIPRDVQDELKPYLIKNHPGYRNNYVEDSDDEDDSNSDG